MIGFNDTFIRGRLSALTAVSANALFSGPCRVYGIIATPLNSTVRSTHVVYDSLTQGSGREITVGHEPGMSSFADFGPGGIQFSTGISVTLDLGGNSELSVLYLPEVS